MPINASQEEIGCWNGFVLNRLLAEVSGIGNCCMNRQFGCGRRGDYE